MSSAVVPEAGGAEDRVRGKSWQGRKIKPHPHSEEDAVQLRAVICCAIIPYSTHLNISPLIVKTAVTLFLVVVPLEHVMYGRGQSRAIEIPWEHSQRK